VLVLFAQRFAGDTEPYAVADEPQFVDADKADDIAADHWVIGIRFGDRSFAYPMAVLYAEPVVVQTEHDRKLVIFWNARANRVTAFEAATDFRGRDLDIVGTPAGSLLVYNAAHAQFIVGVTGLTPDRQSPTGLLSPLATVKTTFAKWKQANPGGKVMRPGVAVEPGRPTAPIDADGNPLQRSASIDPRPGTAAAATTAPTTRPTLRRGVLVGTARPLAVEPGEGTGRAAMVKIDDRPAVLIPDPANRSARAYLRKLDDLTPRFEPTRDPSMPDVRMRDVETGSFWSSAGVAVGGNLAFRGRRLPAMPVDEDVDLELVRRWVPDLQVYEEPPPPPTPTVPPTPAASPAKGKSAGPSTGTPPARTIRRAPPTPTRRVRT
jgi:hypothetical protein